MSAPVVDRGLYSVHLKCITMMCNSFQGADMGSGPNSA